MLLFNCLFLEETQFKNVCTTYQMDRVSPAVLSHVLLAWHGDDEGLVGVLDGDPVPFLEVLHVRDLGAISSLQSKITWMT